MVDGKLKSTIVDGKVFADKHDEQMLEIFLKTDAFYDGSQCSYFKETGIWYEPEQHDPNEDVIVL